MYYYLVPLLILISSLSAASPRDYERPMTAIEEEKIRFIITTLSSQSAIGLLISKPSLQEAGTHVQEVHPLRFMGFIFSDPELRIAVKRIGSIPWHQFVAGMEGNFEAASSRNNLSDSMIHDFALQIDQEFSEIQPFFIHHKWANLLNYIRNHL